MRALFHSEPYCTAHQYFSLGTPVHAMPSTGTHLKQGSQWLCIRIANKLLEEHCCCAVPLPAPQTLHLVPLHQCLSHCHTQLLCHDSAGRKCSLVKLAVFRMSTSLIMQQITATAVKCSTLSQLVVLPQSGDEGVALESCEFWSAFCEAAVEPGVLRPFLSRLVPVLLRNMVYDDYDEEVRQLLVLHCTCIGTFLVSMVLAAAFDWRCLCLLNVMLLGNLSACQASAVQSAALCAVLCSFAGPCLYNGVKIAMPAVVVHHYLADF